MWFSFSTQGFKCPFLHVEEGPEQPGEGAGTQQSRENLPQKALPEAWARGEPHRGRKNQLLMLFRLLYSAKLFSCQRAVITFTRLLAQRQISSSWNPVCTELQLQIRGREDGDWGAGVLVLRRGCQPLDESHGLPLGATFQFQVARPQNLAPVPQLPDLPSMAQPWWKAVMLRSSCHPGCCVWGGLGLGEARSLRRSGGGVPQGHRKVPGSAYSSRT